METTFGNESQSHHIYRVNAADLTALGKRSLEWDLNDWKWDGDLFIASRLNPVPSSALNGEFVPIATGLAANGNSSNSSSSCSDEMNLVTDFRQRELEKRRRVVVREDEVGGLSLKLGGHGFPVSEREIRNCEGNSGNQAKSVGVGGSMKRAVCQVEDCRADLTTAKDYHRRHKVCEMHSKASKALVGNVMQRFCQQCSRFHVLKEFDEGKRSCRRRLAGHNKRRRKTNPDAVGNANTLNDEQTTNYLLISLLKILANMHSNGSDQVTDQNLLSHLVRSLASQSIEHGGRNLSGLLQDSRVLLNDGTSMRNSEMPQEVVFAHGSSGANIHASSSMKCILPNNCPAYSKVQDSTAEQVKINNFDLNEIYVDSDNDTEDIGRSPVPMIVGTSSLDYPTWVREDSHQSSPPQTSGNSDSASAQSPSSSSGDTQVRTDRIIFKLFGKEPTDFPFVLRAQILDWLSHSPTDIESYIRPGCVILTIYLRQAEATWEELCYNLSFSLSRLLDIHDDAFWRAGWAYIMVQHQIAFVYNGQVVVDASLPLRSSNYSKILSVKPIATSAAERVKFMIKGINLSRTTRLLCAVEGKYMLQEDSEQIMDDTDDTKAHDERQCINFCCSIPTLCGRGFIEIEDHGLSTSFFPFIVADDDVCSEIRMLEDVLDNVETDAYLGESENIEAKNQAMDFIHEIGWLLHRSQLDSRLGHLNPCTDLFSLRRFKWLIEFSMDHEWSSVVKKLLNMLHDGIVSTGEHSSLNLALSEMGLLHRAVRKNSRSLVELLLRYVPEKSGSGNKLWVDGALGKFLFRPDVTGPAGLTPLHIAAGKDGSEDVLDALTDDPAVVGIEAWKNAQDSTGFTPEDYARLRGHYSYIHLVQKKINRRPTLGHMAVDIPEPLSGCNINQKQKEASTSFEVGQPEMKTIRKPCKVCHQKLDYGMPGRSLLYRPAMLSMVAIAAVCVCVALLFKSSPEVYYIFRPFRWELLDYGTS